MTLLARINHLRTAETRADIAEAQVVALEARLPELEAQRDRLREMLQRVLRITGHHCGWLPHEDQQTLREARAAVEESR